MEKGVFPKTWKSSYIIPVHKGNERNKVDNYRGVCNQSAILKLLDSIRTTQIQWSASSIISNSQHDFFPKKSTLTNLLEYQSFLNESFSNRCQVVSVYTDFSKAFDRVNHRLLIRKMNKLGFNDKTLKWLSSFLADRWQQVN